MNGQLVDSDIVDYDIVLPVIHHLRHRLVNILSNLYKISLELQHSKY